MEWMVIACIRLIDHHQIAYRTLYRIGRYDVLCDDDKEIEMMMMMMMNEGDK